MIPESISGVVSSKNTLEDYERVLYLYVGKVCVDTMNAWAMTVTYYGSDKDHVHDRSRHETLSSSIIVISFAWIRCLNFLKIVSNPHEESGMNAKFPSLMLLSKSRAIFVTLKTETLSPSIVISFARRRCLHFPKIGSNPHKEKWMNAKFSSLMLLSKSRDRLRNPWKWNIISKYCKNLCTEMVLKLSEDRFKSTWGKRDEC